MASPPQGQKKGPPPPVAIPPPFSQRPILPGPNAFAVAEQIANAEQEELRKQPSWSRTGAVELDGEVQGSTHGGDLSPRLSHSNSMISRLSSKEAYADLIEGVRKSPKKVNHGYQASSTPSRYAKQPEQNYHGPVEVAQRRLEGLSEEMTSRAEIEAKHERKYQKMLGHLPPTPATGAADLTGNHVKVNDLRRGRSSEQSEKSDQQEKASRSPKKKIFGLSNPFSSKPVLETPPMPLKAAKIMGATPPTKTRKFSPLPTNLVGLASVPRSDTSRSLPSKLFNPPGRHGQHGRRRSPPISDETSRARRRSPPLQPVVFSHKKTRAPKEKVIIHPAPKSPLKQPIIYTREEGFKSLDPSLLIEVPPLPPRKDSLPQAVRLKLQKYPEYEKMVKRYNIENAYRRPPTPEEDFDDKKDSGMRLLVPHLTPSPDLDPIPKQGGKSPTKYCPTAASCKPEVVEGQPLASSKAIVHTIQEEDESNYHSAPPTSPGKAPLLAVRGDRQSAPPTPIGWYQAGNPPVEAVPLKDPSPKLEYLQPTVYAPPPRKSRKAKADATPPKAPSPGRTATKLAALKKSTSPPVEKVLDWLPGACVPSPWGRTTNESAAPQQCTSPQVEDLLVTVDVPASAAKRMSFQTDRSQQRDDSPARNSHRETITVLFDGDLNDIGPEPTTTHSADGGTDIKERIMEQLGTNPAAGPSVNGLTPGQAQDALRPEHSSSQLTDMLSGVSPSKVNFRDFNNSSAAPSPLHSAPQPPYVGPSTHDRNVAASNEKHGLLSPANIPPVLGHDASMHDHFFMTNEHIDVLGTSVFDWVQSQNNMAMKATSSKHEQLKAFVEQQFNGLKLQINNMGEKADDLGNQTHNLSVQLDNLRDFIKSDVIEPLVAQSKKTDAMEHGLKDLRQEIRQAMQELQHKAAPSHSTPHQSPPFLPNSRSQPVLPAYYDANGSASAFGRAGNMAPGRESRENTQPFPSIGNPYRAPGSAFNNAYAAGGYQPFSNYPPHDQTQAYGYGQGLQK